MKEILKEIRFRIRELRNRRSITENFNKFDTAVRLNVIGIAEHFNSRWIVSIADTYADFGEPQIVRSNAMLISLFVNMIRLGETVYNGCTPMKLVTIGHMYDGLTYMHYDKQDTLLNLSKRINRIMDYTPVLEPLWYAVVEKAKSASDGNYVNRFMVETERPAWVFPQNAVEIADNWGIK
jgi:hypothetical protein